MVQWFELLKSGLWPLAGAGLDQTQSYLTAMQCLAAEENRWKKELGVFEP
ncbi:MAG: hypothetical protein BWY71_00130 [Planctomycetes bacterium ADurb.Bin412]|nr:MAG: hypothetical protein BWY71_00130 [Planctomycetes bacterium ADurb.Bin412]